MIGTRKVFHVIVGAIFAFCALYAAFSVADLDGPIAAVRAKPTTPYHR